MTLREQIARFPFSETRHGVPTLVKRSVFGRVECYFDLVRGQEIVLISENLMAPSSEWGNSGAATLGQMAEAAMTLTKRVPFLRALPGKESVSYAATRDGEEDKELHFTFTVNGISQDILLQTSDLPRFASTWYSWFSEDFPDNPVTWYITGVTDQLLEYMVFSPDIGDSEKLYNDVDFYFSLGTGPKSAIERTTTQNLLSFFQAIKESKNEHIQYPGDESKIQAYRNGNTLEFPGCPIIHNADEYVGRCLALITDSEIGQVVPIGRKDLSPDTKSALIQLREALK